MFPISLRVKTKVVMMPTRSYVIWTLLFLWSHLLFLFVSLLCSRHNGFQLFLECTRHTATFRTLYWLSSLPIKLLSDIQMANSLTSFKSAEVSSSLIFSIRPWPAHLKLQPVLFLHYSPHYHTFHQHSQPPLSVLFFVVVFFFCY